MKREKSRDRRRKTEVRKTWDRIPTNELVEVGGLKSENRRRKTEDGSKKKEVKIAVSLSEVEGGYEN